MAGVLGTSSSIDVGATTTSAYGQNSANEFYITSFTTGSGGTAPVAAYTACESSTGAAVICPTNAKSHLLGVTTVATASGYTRIAARNTIASVTFDAGNAVAGDWAVTSATAGEAKDTGSATFPTCGTEVLGYILGTGTGAQNVFVKPEVLIPCGTDGQVWTASGTTAAGWAAASSKANHYVDLIAGVLQGAGCSINNSFLTGASAVGCYSLTGSATTPSMGFPQFSAAGVIGTGSTLMIGPKTLPSDYATNANIVLNFGIGDHVDTTGAATFSARYSCQAVPAVIQPTYYSTDYGTGSVNVSGTIDNSVAGTATITPNTGGSPACAAGNQVWFAVYLSAKTATNAVYLSQLYMSY